MPDSAVVRARYSRLAGAPWAGAAIAFAAYLLIVLFVKEAPIGGDQMIYWYDIKRSLDKPWQVHSIWNFAHVLWRPYGRAMTLAFQPLVAPFFGGSQNLTIAFFLVLPNVLGGAACAILVQRMVEKLTGSLRASLVTTFTLLGLNTVLNYSRAGSPYIFCLSALLAAIYLVAFKDRVSPRTSFLAGVVAAIPVMLWLPFLLSMPAILFSGCLLYPGGKRRGLDWRRATWFCAGAALIGL